MPFRPCLTSYHPKKVCFWARITHASNQVSIFVFWISTYYYLWWEIISRNIKTLFRDVIYCVDTNNIICHLPPLRLCHTCRLIKACGLIILNFNPYNFINLLVRHGLVYNTAKRITKNDLQIITRNFLNLERLLIPSGCSSYRAYTS